jgi:cytochrome c biogenesis protein CcmG, thiol:disulfide interchange protein DsbE
MEMYCKSKQQSLVFQAFHRKEQYLKKLKKSMLNLLVIVAVLLLSVALTACNKAEKNDKEQNQTENKTVQDNNTKEDSWDNTNTDQEGTDTDTEDENGSNEDNETDESAVSDVKEEENPLVPDFTLKSSEGEEISLSDYSGKVVVLNFWASWCPPCKEEMPEFQKLYDELAESEDAVLLMLNQTDGQRETEKKANSYIEEEGLTFPILYDTGEVGGSIFGINSIPTTVVIDKEGRLSDYVLGRTEYSKVAQMIEEAK